jgi:hypothetical protein
MADNDNVPNEPITPENVYEPDYAKIDRIKNALLKLFQAVHPTNAEVSLAILGLLAEMRVNCEAQGVPFHNSVGMVRDGVLSMYRMHTVDRQAPSEIRMDHGLDELFDFDGTRRLNG